MSRSGRVGRWQRATIWGLLLLSLVAAPISRADDDEPDDDDMSLADKAAERFPQPVAIGALLHRTVLEPLESQPVLGHVDAVVRLPDTSVKVVVRYGGFWGFGGKPIAVPVEAMVLLGEYMEIVDFSPEELDAFPKFDGTGAKPLAPDEIIRVGLARPSH